MLPIIGPVAEFANSIVEQIGKFIPDKTKLAEIEAQIQQQAVQVDQELASKQMDINLAEAQSPNMFIAGWRPFIGWVGGVALAYQTILYGFLQWGFAAFHFDPTLMPPPIQSGLLQTILLVMLGAYGSRTIEKLFNRENNR